MRKLLFVLLCIIMTFNMSAQTTETYNLDWFTGIGSNVDLTIETGDEVIWTWTNPNHTVENIVGSSVEDFSSGFLGPTGSVFAYTFTAIGDNDYFCSIHGVGSMSGTITVVAEGTLSTPPVGEQTKFSIFPNPSSEFMNISIPENSSETLKLEVFNVLGKRVLTQQLNNLNSKINISKWNSGVYLVRLNSSDNTTTLTKRFVKL